LKLPYQHGNVPKQEGAEMAEMRPEMEHPLDEAFEEPADMYQKPYNWRLYSPTGRNCVSRANLFRSKVRLHHPVTHSRRTFLYLQVNFFRWMMVGGVQYAKQSDEEMKLNVLELARCLVFLREYKQRFGMPQDGGPRDQEFVLRNVLQDLYAGGVSDRRAGICNVVLFLSHALPFQQIPTGTHLV
jgi:hypothetical protein